ncbi:hypothetical protein IWQ60_008264 [Tieghemiomyces parasiticus]|uniref:Phospholipase/carboxylesterase/thioesterase domain-containing protein n=1 Tax=Tieghemiomyces parasiticus TaxID=78921 RepID=A0A9W7ZTT4_9FUNG|nr:hypothetical protein IWQ60_008264 [Tieghemiomyces parasiticus]
MVQPIDRSPRASEFPGLQFEYRPSPDGHNHNLLILFHGLGDTPANFIQAAIAYHIPQTALLAVAGPAPIPYFPEGTGWFPAFDVHGDPLPAGHPDRIRGLKGTREWLARLISSYLCDTKGWRPEEIFLFGFSQGGTAALDLALCGSPVAGTLGGVVSVSGLPVDEALQTWRGTATSKPLFEVPAAIPTPILITCGTADAQIPVSKAETTVTVMKEHLKACRIELLRLPNKGHTMPQSEREIRAILEFLAQHLRLRDLALAKDPTVIEVTGEKFRFNKMG